MTGNYKYIAVGLLFSLLITACSKDGADGNDVSKPNEGKKEIRIQTNVSSVQNGTRATTIDNNTALQSCNLKIDAYYHGTDDKYLDGTTLHYDTSDDPGAWKFWNTSTEAQEHYYWPITGSTVAGGSTVASILDFVGFCPYDPPGYIANLSYTHGSGASFTCNMSSYMTLEAQASMQEFLVSVLPNQTLATQTDAEGALPMVFKHPLAIIKFTITAASGTHVQINSISISDLKTSGTCTYNGTTMTWSGQSGSATMTIAQTLKNGGTTETTNYLVIPNNYGSKYLTVNATWDDWSNTVTISNYGTNVDFNWEPGYIYTYNLTLDKTGLIVNTSKFTEQW